MHPVACAFALAIAMTAVCGCNHAVVSATGQVAPLTGQVMGSQSFAFHASRWSDIPGMRPGQLLGYHVSAVSALGEAGPASLIQKLRLAPTTIIPPLPPPNGERYFFYAFGRTAAAIHVRLVRCDMPMMTIVVIHECKFPLTP